MSRQYCITIPGESVVISGEQYDYMGAELGRLQRENAELRGLLEQAEAQLNRHSSNASGEQHG